MPTHKSSKERWRDLVRSFPTLTAWASEHPLEDATALLAALGVVYDDDSDRWVEGPRERVAYSTGARYALLFCLDVWNTSTRGILPERWRNWSIVTAFGRWDQEHQAVAAAFFQDPFFP